MNQHPLDDPRITENLFFPRKAIPHTHPDSDTIKDGTIPVEDVELGYRLYIHTTTAPLLFFFHGNGEVASDYDSLAPLYHNAGVSLLVVDYRGYGWSTGRTLTSRMLPDAQAVLDALDGLLAEHGVVPGRPLFVKGRSLGSAPAVYVALKHPERFKGLILESGYADAPSLFRRMGLPIPDNIPENDSLPINNASKMKRVKLPLLVIHGEHDTLIPAEQGKALYEASPSANKQLLIIPGAGHNNLLMAGVDRYFGAIADFVKQWG